MSHSDSTRLQIPAAKKDSMAGSIQTCSVFDRQRNFFRLTRDTPNSYQISLTVDPTPLYRVEMPQSKKRLSQKPLKEKFQSEKPESERPQSEKPENEKIENEKAQSEIARNTAAFDTILLFDALDSKIPIATCCLVTKGEPVATMCPYPEAQYQLSEVTTSHPWIPIYKMGFFSLSDYKFKLPIVMVPGCRPFNRSFDWSSSRLYNCLELRMTDEDTGDRGSRANIYATWYYEKGWVFEKGVLEIRRGGGLPFELGVVISAVAIYEMRGH